MTEAGDKYLEAAGVEEVVIAPEGKEDVLGGDDVAAALFLTYHYFNETHSIKVVVIIIISNRYTVFYQPKMSIIPKIGTAPNPGTWGSDYRHFVRVK